MSALVPNGGAGLSGSGRRSKFPRGARLLRHADFERVYKQGRRHFAAHMTVFYLRRTSPEGQGESSARVPRDGARVGFTVGKVLGGAVVRNRMKRRLREAVRLHGQIAADCGCGDQSEEIFTWGLHSLTCRMKSAGLSK